MASYYARSLAHPLLTRVPGESHRLTFKRRETTIQDQFKIAKLALVKDNSRKLLGLSSEFLTARSIASDEVLELTTWQ